MGRKNRAFEEEGAAIGHNSGDKNKLSIGYTQQFMEIEEKIAVLKGEQKDILNEAKNAGILKTAVRKASKTLRSTPEQEQAKNEVEVETKAIIKLFAQSDGQYSWLLNSDAA